MWFLYFSMQLLWWSKFYFKSTGAQYSGQPYVNWQQDRNFGSNDRIFSASFHANSAVIYFKDDGSDPILREALGNSCWIWFCLSFTLPFIVLQQATILIYYIWNYNLWTCNKISEGKINSIRLIIVGTPSSIEF